MWNSWLSTWERGPELTVQSQHRREVLAVGHACGIGHAGFPQVGPEGGCGDDRPVHGGHLPVVRGQSGRHQDPPRDAQQKGHNLRRHVSHCIKKCISCLRLPDCVPTKSFSPSVATWVSPPRYLARPHLCLQVRARSCTIICCASGSEVGACLHSGRHSTPGASGSACWEEVLNWKDLKSLWPGGKLLDLLENRLTWFALVCTALTVQQHTACLPESLLYSYCLNLSKFCQNTLRCTNALQVGSAAGGSAPASPWFYTWETCDAFL